MASSYSPVPSPLPVAGQWHDALVTKRNGVTEAVNLMTQYDATDRVQLNFLVAKVADLRELIDAAAAELARVDDPMCCGRSKQRCRRYSLCSVETLIFASGVALIVADYATSGNTVTALKITGAVFALLSKCVSNVTTICIGNSDEEKSKNVQELSEVAGDRSFLRLAEATLEEITQAFTQISDAGVPKAKANRALFQADQAVRDLRKAYQAETAVGERVRSEGSMLTYAAMLRRELYQLEEESTDFVVNID